jgi:TolB-like protein/tetratricopeptide (TPR) repeat protein
VSLVPGGQLGAYQIVASLGSGGMGEVYRAHDPRLGRDVALKVLPAEMASDPSRLERFTREARAIAALNHPHIVTIYSTEEAGAIRFLTMELVEGQSLDALIPSGGMTLARFLELAIPLADALNAAHQKQITHRDLKPGNVMVASDGRLKVLDFGLASAPAKVGASIDDDGTGFSPADMVTSPQITTPGMVIGTMPYMSPEQVEGKQLDHRTDLFSLGVMFHEMLVGSRPFTGASPPQLMSSILRDTPSSTSDLRTEVPDTLSRLIVRCLEKHPDDRVQTARDVYNELRHVQRQLESGSVRRVSSAGAAVAPIADSLWIAVLPFTTRGTDPDGESLAAGLTEDITAALARFPSLSVVALQSASSFKGAQLDVRTIAERLRARYIMGGSVRKSASGIRVAAHLTDATSGAQLWTETYDRAGDRLDIYAVQDDVTDRVVSTVADKTGVLARSMVQAVRGIPLDKLSGPELVYRCWGAHLNPSPTEQEELRAALESFLARRPDEPELWAQLSQFYTFEYSLWFNPLDSLVRARRAARRAIELDPSNQEGWVSLALACFHDRDEAGLLEAVDRVLRINPRASNAVAWMGNVLTHTGAYDRGCQITDRAMALNASHAGWYHFAPFNRAFARGDFNEALKSARRVNIAGFHWMHIAIAAAAGHLGLSAEGAAAVEALHMVAPPLADDQNLREMVTRWYWFEEVIESLLEGVRRSKNAASEPEATALPRRPRSSPSAAGPVRQPPSSATVAAGTWVAVIPFMSPSSDEDSRTLADGLTEDITAGLARFPYLSVVAAHSARQHKGTTADVRQIGKALGARYILDGGIRRGGSSIRITARLVDAESGAQLWSETYTREIQQGNLLALQDDVTDRVVATVADVHGVLLRSASGNVRAVPIDQLGLEELRLRYWSYHRQHAPIEHGLLRDHFERLVEAQPAFSPFWAALAHLYLHEYGFGFNARPQPLLRARQAVDRALELDSLNQHAWEALAFTLFFEQDREGFAHAVDRVLALNPRNANAMALMGVLFVHAGELERGSALADRAMVINPDHPGWYHIARGSRDYASGDFEAALRSAKRINMPQHLWAHARRDVVGAARPNGRDPRGTRDTAGSGARLCRRDGDGRRRASMEMAAGARPADGRRLPQGDGASERSCTHAASHRCRDLSRRGRRSVGRHRRSDRCTAGPNQGSPDRRPSVHVARR